MIFFIFVLSTSRIEFICFLLKSLQDANIGDISIMYTKYLNSDEYYSSKRFKTSYDVALGDTCLLFSNQEANQEKQESIFQDDFWGEETSSCDSTTSKPLEINCF